MLKIRRYEPRDNKVAKELNYAGLKQMMPEINWEGIAVADADYDDIEGIYQNNRGDFVVGEINDEVVVTGAVKKLTETTAEIKRIRVRPDLQRKGYGETMLKRLIEIARELGYEKIRIDTLDTNTRAQQLFKKSGFKESYRGKIGDYNVIFYFLEPGKGGE
jgi:N-acetylglutamate synthase-like GNAT family acetyltransferase